MVLIVFVFPISIIASMTIYPGFSSSQPSVWGYTSRYCAFRLVLLVSSILSRRAVAHSKDHFVFCAAVLTHVCGFFAIPLIGMPWTLSAYAWIGVKAYIVAHPISHETYVLRDGRRLVFFHLMRLFLLARFCDGSPIFDMMAINMAPMLIATLLMMYYRRILVTVIDVSLVIRPAMNSTSLPSPGTQDCITFLHVSRTMIQRRWPSLQRKVRIAMTGGVAQVR